MTCIGIANFSSHPLAISLVQTPLKPMEVVLEPCCAHPPSLSIWFSSARSLGDSFHKIPLGFWTFSFANAYSCKIGQWRVSFWVRNPTKHRTTLWSGNHLTKWCAQATRRIYGTEPRLALFSYLWTVVLFFFPPVATHPACWDGISMFSTLSLISMIKDIGGRWRMLSYNGRKPFCLQLRLCVKRENEGDILCVGKISPPSRSLIILYVHRGRLILDLPKKATKISFCLQCGPGFLTVLRMSLFSCGFTFS